MRIPQDQWDTRIVLLVCFHVPEMLIFFSRYLYIIVTTSDFTRVAEDCIKWVITLCLWIKTGFVSADEWWAALLVAWHHWDDTDLWFGAAWECTQGISKHISQGKNCELECAIFLLLQINEHQEVLSYSRLKILNFARICFFLFIKPLEKAIVFLESNLFTNKCQLCVVYVVPLPSSIACYIFPILPSPTVCSFSPTSIILTGI